MPAAGDGRPAAPVEAAAASTAVTSDLALRAVASMPVDVSFDIDVPRDQYSGLHAEYQRYRNAANINELAPSSAGWARSRRACAGSSPRTRSTATCTT